MQISFLKNRSGSLKLRVIAKIATNIFVAFYNLIFSILIPRAIGPAGFGLFELINSNMNSILGLLSAGTTGAFYSKLSQRQNDIGLIRFFFKIIFIILIVSVLILFASLSFLNFDKILENRNATIYIIFAFIFAFGLFLTSIIRDIADVYVLTLKNERNIIIIKGFGVLIILFLFFTNNLTILTLYFKESLIVLLITSIGFVLIKKHWHNNISKPFTETPKKQLILEFWKYCRPLIVMAFLTSIATISERWILQVFNGSAQQGYYSLALRISSLGMLIGGALSTLLIREVAIAIKENDIRKIGRLLKKSLKFMYVVVGLFSAFAFVYSKEIITLMVGEKFIGAIVPMQILIFYPLHQLYGQYTSSYFLGSGKTKIFKNISIFSVFSSLIMTWVLIAPTNLFGFNLGSMGLAIKTVFVNIIFTNINLFFITRYVKIAFKPFIYHQVIVISTFVLISLFSKYSIQYFISNPVFNIIIGGFFYFFIIIFLLIKIPFLTGLKKEEILYYLTKFKLIRIFKPFL